MYIKNLIIFRSIGVHFMISLCIFSYIWIFYFSVESNLRVIKISLYKWFQNNICVILEGFIYTIFKTIKCDIIAWTLRIIVLTRFFSTIINNASHIFHCTLKIIKNKRVHVRMNVLLKIWMCHWLLHQKKCIMRFFFYLYKINVAKHYLIKVFLKKFCSSSLYFQCDVLMFNLIKKH